MTEETLLQFPCEFPIKVMGHATPEFRSLVLGIVARHFGEIDESRITERPSKGGKYVSLTVTVTATSKPPIDAVYRELTACQQVRFVL
jgi:putative lipoic acid-binding regulatory protein